jgi:hypothetical protein
MALSFFYTLSTLRNASRQNLVILARMVFCVMYQTLHTVSRLKKMVFENSFAKISDYIRHNRKQINVLVPIVSMW